MPEKFFNTAGPQKPEINYTISSFERIDWPEIHQLIIAQRYFLLHAPRQTGKTTALAQMVDALNEQDEYTALYVNIEAAQAARNNITLGNRTICNSIARAVSLYQGDDTLIHWFDAQEKGDNAWLVFNMLQQWCLDSPKPIVLFIDEVDALVGDTLISLLRQLRTGYMQRPNAFPHSILLCGVRDLRDYRIHQSSGDVITGGSAFNIKAKSLTLGNFTPDEVRQLYQQHSDATGQPFDEKIFPELWLDSVGQPWLVNALAHEMTWEDKSRRDRTQTITLEHYFAARERLIQSRATHLDQLADKLKEQRVHGVIAPMLAGEDEFLLQVPPDDRQYVEDLGLIVSKPTLHISNRIYREVIPRELTWITQTTIANQQTEWYLSADNRLDMVKLLGAFRHFFRDNSEIWLERFDYKEAGPQLLMQAFLQRIINGGGRINREYALGRKRTDLIIEWPVSDAGYFGEVQRVVVELKLLRGSLERVMAEGVAQTSEYADGCGAAESHLILFNRDPDIPWEDKLWYKPPTAASDVHCWGC